MTFQEAKDVLRCCEYRDWHIVLLDYEICGHWYLQVKFKERDVVYKGRKWLISPHMTKSELVRTAFKAIITAQEHEVREHFMYRGAKVFGPHINVDVLARMSSLTDRREPHEQLLEAQEVPSTQVPGVLQG